MPGVISHYTIHQILCSNNNEKPALPPRPKFVFLTQTSPLSTVHILHLHSDAFQRQQLKLNMYGTEYLFSLPNVLFFQYIISQKTATFSLLYPLFDLLSKSCQLSFNNPQHHLYPLLEVRIISHLDYDESPASTLA